MSQRSIRDDINRIDLGRHGLIEASAGTGKTYTIESLVVRLLKEHPDLDLENILLVTFTEKAASELKIRIREKIERTSEDDSLDPMIHNKLRSCVDEFDRAAIHTIHGFCQTVLKDFAFENRTPFQAEVIPDAPLYETLLKEQMRKDWPGIYGEDLPELLALSGFSEKKDDFLKTVIRLAMSLHAEAGDLILPHLDRRDFKEIKEEILSACMAVKAMIPPGFSSRYEQLNFHAGARKSVRNKMVGPVEDYFSGLREDAFDLNRFSRLMADVEATTCADRRGLDCLVPVKWNKGGPNLHVCPELPSVKEGLEELSRQFRDLRYHLTAASVHRLQSDVVLTKAAHGWIGYYDMLALVETALAADHADEPLKRLRARFKVAFIDEFQDTDPVQWRIFKRIFIDSPNEYCNRLFLIGDPKQAIYSFRGADVYVYLTARSEITRLAEQEKAGRYSLSINWRSDPRLIAAFNRLFGHEAWFGPEASSGPFDIGYPCSEAPPCEGLLAEVIEDHSNRPVLNIVDLCDASSPRPAKLRLARFVAHEIGHLMNASIRIREKGKGKRPIDYGDMAILIRGKSDLPFLEDALKREHIPYAFYKKPGLFASDEAVYVSLICHAILDPGDGSAVKKALLTPFFGLRVQDLYAYEEMPPTHPVKEILFRWNGYAVTRRWGYLFQSLMEDSGLLTRGAGRMGWDRSYANYRQLFEYLKEVAYRKNLDFRGLSTVLDLHRNAAWEAEEGVDIHQIETDSGKVQIMTMHVSKGLQFPVVFVAGGLTQPMAHLEAFHVYHPLDTGQGTCETARVFDLSKSGGDGRHEREKTDEDKRLYYVAATRAQFKLYLPFYIYEKVNGSWLGPVCTLLSPVLGKTFPKEEPNPDVLWLEAGHSLADGDTSGGGRAFSRTEGAGLVTGFEDLLIPDSYEQRRIRVDSFSSLHRDQARGWDKAVEDISFQTDEEKKEVDEAVEVWDRVWAPEEGRPDGMPGGTDVGLMFHGILERMDYGVVRRSRHGDKDPCRGLLEDPGARDIILGQMAANGVDARWRDAVSRILWNTLTAPVPPLGHGFTLGSLDRMDRLHETAFYYTASGPPDGGGSASQGRWPNRLVRGFIDLIFRNEGRYYVADWKSNLLEGGYDPVSLETSMADSGYHLQYKLYAVAALRWLRQALGDRFDPIRDWGGICYFYLRGMGGAVGDGIYFVPAEKLGSMEQLEAEVGSMLDA